MLIWNVSQFNHRGVCKFARGGERSCMSRFGFRISGVHCMVVILFFLFFFF